ncbi:MAG: HAMP domain-containing sensor histidine kinase [Acidimicrobiales bacterium]
MRQMAVAANDMAERRPVDPIDVTGADEVGRLAEAFNSMTTDLAEADRRQREFIANASHELRTPVAALRGTLENLADGVGRPDAKTIAVLLHHAEHLGDLVTQLLDLSRLDALDGIERPERIDLGDLLHDVAGRTRLVTPDTTVDLKTAIDLPVHGDAARLAQLFTNLLTNAVRFSPDGAPVTITACSTSDDDRRIRVSVSDTGPGIPDDRKAMVFERFWQDDRPPSGQRGGAGLGLAIAKRIVETHRGTIQITDRSPAGTTVIVELPRA